MQERYEGSEANAAWKAEEGGRTNRELDMHSAVGRERTFLDRFRGRAGDVARVLAAVTVLTAFGELPKAQALNLPRTQNQEQPVAEGSGWRKATSEEQAEAERSQSAKTEKEEKEKNSEKQEEKEDKKGKRPGRVKRETEKMKQKAEQQIEHRVKVEIWRQQGKIEQKIGQILRFPR